jgi:hypothetical protein
MDLARYLPANGGSGSHKHTRVRKVSQILNETLYSLRDFKQN